MMLITDLGDFLNALFLLEVIERARKQVIRVDACLQAQGNALLID
jgi:hypothetical protein